MPCWDCGEAMTPTLLVCLPCADKRQTRDGDDAWFTILLKDTGMTPNEKHDKGDRKKGRTRTPVHEQVDGLFESGE